LVETEPVLDLRHRHWHAAANTWHEFAWSNPYASHALFGGGPTIKRKLPQVIGACRRATALGRVSLHVGRPLNIYRNEEADYRIG